MIFLYFFIIPLLYLPTKTILSFIVHKFGKVSYDGFSAAGFAYDSEKDIFYSTKNAWQKNFGYSHLYDVCAPLFNMILDTEPIKFYYNKKNWLITFWKGQYGITTGAEIGIYCTKDQIVNKKTIYFPANEQEMLDMSFVLYRKNFKIINVHSKHWWLTGFKLGMFSKPRKLTMDIQITFPNEEMLNSFLKAFKKKHHRKKYYNVTGSIFSFRYQRPHSIQVWTRFWLSDVIRQHINRKNVKLYNKFLAHKIDNNGIDDSQNKQKLIYVNKFLPDIIKNKKIIDTSEMIDSNEKIILLNNNIYSNLKRNKL